MPRLFVGLDLPTDVQNQLSANSGGLDGARWISPQDFHITLRFIGDIDNHIADEIDQQLHRLRHEVFTLRSSSLEVFGGRNPRSLCLGIEPEPALTRLQRKIDTAVRSLTGRTDQKKYTPHITLARFRHVQPPELAQFISGLGQPRVRPVEYTQFHLFSARDSVGGGPYRIEASYPLQS